MNKPQLKALLAVNLRLLNPQVTDRYRKKGKSGRTLTKKLTLQFFVNMFVFILIYGVTMVSFDFTKLPGMFTFYVGLFVLLAFSQSISGIYNIFFAGKDLANYLPLPFQQQEIFLSKILIVSFNVVPFTLPMLLVFILTGWRAGMMIPLAILLGLIAYLLINAVILLACSLIVFGLTKTKLFRDHQNLVINGLMIITTIIAVGGIMLINSNNSSSGAELDRPTIQFLLPVFQMFAQPFSKMSGITWLGLVVLLVFFGSLIKKFVLPHLSEQLTQANNAFSSSSSKHKGIHRHGLKKNLDQYNRLLLKEPNLLLQVIMNSVMIPLVFTISFGFAKIPTDLPMKWIGVFFVGGILFSLLTTTQTSLIGNLISLDRKNFEFVETLPISMTDYLKRKFQLGYWFQLIINAILILVVVIVLKVGWLMLLALLVGNILGTYFVSQHYFSRDYRLRVTNWTNVTELFNRGGGNLGMVATMFANIFVSGIVIAAYAFAIYLIPYPALINEMVFIAIVIGVYFVWRHYQQSFWKKFN